MWHHVHYRRWQLTTDDDAVVTVTALVVKKNWCYFRTSHYLWSSFSCPFGFQSTAKERAKHAADYFTLLRHLLNYAFNSNINLPNAEVLLNNEIDWLKRIRVCSFKLLFGIKIVKTLVCKFEGFFFSRMKWRGLESLGLKRPFWKVILVSQKSY